MKFCPSERYSCCRSKTHHPHLPTAGHSYTHRALWSADEEEATRRAKPLRRQARRVPSKLGDTRESLTAKVAFASRHLPSVHCGGDACPPEIRACSPERG